MERTLNGHMKWLVKMLNMGSYWKHEDRNKRNMLNYGLAVCKMTVLIKDHKSWSVNETLPGRAVMAGNMGGNTNISELLSAFLEPIASENTKCMEVNSTDGLLAEIDKMNEENSIHPTEHENLPDGLKQCSKTDIQDHKPCEQDDDTLPGGWQQITKEKTKSEDSFFITNDEKNKTKTLHINDDTQRYSSPQEDLSSTRKESKTKLIRRKMMEARMKRFKV